MKTTKNRLFKTLTMVMLLFIMAFTVTGCTPDTLNTKEALIKYTKTTITLNINYNCYVEITIKVLDGQKEDTLTKSININKNDRGEILRIEDFVSDYYYSDEAIITEIVSIDFIEQPASE